MTPTTGRHLELYLRDETRGLAGRRQDDVRERAAALADTPAVDSVREREWPRKIAVEGPGPVDEDAEAAFNAFSNWAREHDAHLYPAFGIRACYAWDTGRRYTALVLPVLALAVYEDDELVAVYPHADDDRCYTVFDGLAALETDAQVPAPADDHLPTLPAD